MILDTLVDRLDAELRTDDFTEIDGSPNGLQVGDPTATVERVALAVDAATATIDAAADWDADLLVTHHGLWWGGIEHLTGRSYDHVSRLIEADMGLYVSHLPLDAHPSLGNAAVLAEDLGLVETDPFASHGSEHIGRMGPLSEDIDLDSFVAQLSDVLPGPAEPQVLPFGPDTVSEVAIVTGSGVDWVDAAIEHDADVLVTGEGKHRVYHHAREVDLSVVLGGHYATEVGGVSALGALLEEWGLETTTIDMPTGL